MSGKPSPEGAKELLNLMEREEALLAEVDAAKTQVAALRAAEARLDQAAHDLATTTKAIGKLLEDMDCTSAGNWGFEGRMGWLLMEMRRLILAKVDASRRAMADGTKDPELKL